MSTKLLTGHQSVNHIAAPDDAAVNAALITGDNCVIADEKSLAPTINPTTGNVTIGAFTALFSGRKVVSTGETVTYTTPASASLYRHVSIGILYEKDTETDVEECTMAVFTSETDRQSAEAAKKDDTGAESYQTTIGAATTVAYMELFEFVANGSTVSTQESDQKKYSVSGTFDGMKDYVNTARMQYTICVLDHVTASGMYFVEDGGGSISTFLSDKRLAILIFKASTDEKAKAVCHFRPSDGTNICTPTLLKINEVTKHIMFAVYVTQNDEIELGNTHIGDTAAFSDIPFDLCMVYAWR